MDRLQLLAIIGYLDPLSAVATVKALNSEVLYDQKFWTIAAQNKFSEDLSEQYDDLKTLTEVTDAILNFLSKTLPLTLLPKLVENRCYPLIQKMIPRLEKERDELLIRVSMMQAANINLPEVINLLVPVSTEGTIRSMLSECFRTDNENILKVLCQRSLEERKQVLEGKLESSPTYHALWISRIFLHPLWNCRLNVVRMIIECAHRLLLDFGEDQHYLFIMEETLKRTCNRGHIDVIEYLHVRILAHKSLEGITEYKFVSHDYIVNLAEYGYTETLEFIISNSEKFGNGYSEESLVEALESAIIKGRYSTSVLLVRKLSEMKIRDEFKNWLDNALNLSIQDGQAKIFKLLYEKYEITPKDHFKYLNHARRYNRQDIMAYLEKK